MFYGVLFLMVKEMNRSIFTLEICWTSNKKLYVVISKWQKSHTCIQSKEGVGIWCVFVSIKTGSGSAGVPYITSGMLKNILYYSLHATSLTGNKWLAVRIQ